MEVSGRWTPEQADGFDQLLSGSPAFRTIATRPSWVLVGAVRTIPGYFTLSRSAMSTLAVASMDVAGLADRSSITSGAPW